MQDKVSYKKKLRINFSLEESRASRGRRYVLFGTIVILIAFFMVISSMGAGSTLAPSNTTVLSKQSNAIAVYNQSGKETPFANLGSTAEYTSPSNISYILTNVTAGEMSQNDVGSVLINTGSPNSSASASVTYSPLSKITTNNVGTEPQTSISTGGSPKAILYYQANNTIYVANSTGDNVWAINATTGAIIKSIIVGPSGADPGFMALDPVDKHIFVTSAANNSIYVINATTNKLNATITAPTDSNPYGISNPVSTSAPNGIAFDAKTGTLFVVLTNNAVLDELNATQNKITGTFFNWGTDGLAPYTISITASGIIYVELYGMFISTTQYSNHIYVFTTTSNYGSTGLSGNELATSPYISDGMAYDPVNSLMYVADSASNNVYAVNVTSHINATITLPDAPFGVSYIPVGNGGKGFIYVTTSSNQVMLINATSESLVWNGTSASPGEIAFANSTAANKVYMTDTSGQVISFDALQTYKAEFIESCSSGSTNYPPFTLHVSSSAMHPNEINATNNNPKALGNYIIEYLFNASYTWAANSSYQYLPLHGSFTMAGNNPLVVDVIFTQADISITESGLPSGTSWDFNITSPSTSAGTHSSTTTTIDFLMANGNYSYTIPDVKSGSVLYGVSPLNASGNFTILASDFLYTVQFVVANAVTFNESGLTIASGNYAYSQPRGDCYLFAMPISNDYNAVRFNVGTASHTINEVSFFLVGAGKIMFALGSTGVDSTNVLSWVTTNVSSQYGQLFTERISPVTLNGGTDYYFSIDILSGTVSWEEQPTSTALHPGFVQNFCYSGGYTSSTTCSYLYAVGAAPSVGDSSSWGIHIYDYNLSSTGPSIVANLVPGTYNYTTYTNTYLNTTAGTYLFGGNGSVSVTSKAETINITFSPVTLYQKGLPSNKSWSVKFLNGGTVTDSYGTTSLTFPMLEGTYSYTGIAPNANYTASSGSLTISNNSSAVITFTLNTYSVTFTEGLLPQGMSWTVTLGSYSNTSSQPVISLKVANGSYDYMITAAGYTATPSSGQITVSGKSVNVSTTFSLTPLEPIVPAYTITIGFGTSYQNFKPVATFTFTHPVESISIQPYYYLSVSPSDHLMFEINQSAPLHYFAFNLSGNTGAFSGIGYNGFSDIGYIIGGTGVLIALVFSMPWLSVYRENNKWRKKQ